MTRPNILFILIDDLGWRDLACTGSSFYETPRLDGLAAQGMRFSDAYAACPVCSPTRASILTGRYPARLGITDWIGGGTRGRLIDAPYLHYLPCTETTIAAALRDGGYRTYHVGKWHLGEEPRYWPENHGFDVNVAGCGWGAPHHGYFSPWQNPRLSDGAAGEYLTDRVTEEAVRLLEKNGHDPFFMYLSHYAVHIPIQVKPEWKAPFIARAHDRGLDRVDPFAEGPFFPCRHKRDKHILRRLVQSDPAYAAMVANLDLNVGRVLDALDRLGLAESTIVVFTSDNGGLATSEGSPTSNAPLAEGKGWMYEGGTREPLLVRWPGVVRPGSACGVPVTSPDFFPTFLAAAGLPAMPARHSDGVNILPLFKGGTALDREAIFWHYPHYGNQGGTPGSSVRAGDWKLIEFFEDGRLELYNLREDIAEQHDRAGDDPATTRHLHAMLKDWRARVEAKIPEPNLDWHA
ncbi:MAG: sulfatase [Planctomycetota bacterium]